MGATMAVVYIGHAPDRVKQAILIEPGFLDISGYETFEKRRIKLSRNPRVIWASIVAAFRARGVKIDAYAAHDSIVGAAVHAFTNHPDNPYHCGNGYTAPSWRFGGLASDTFWQNVEPTLNAVEAGLYFEGAIMFMAGECNHWIGPNLQREHAERFANAELKIVENAGHDVIWDQPDRAIAMIREFLER
jgi:proline iminopeptidase